MNRANILIVDDHNMVSNGIIKLLNNKESYNKVIASNNVHNVSDLIQSEKIDLLISDISMPDSNRLGYLTKIKETYPKLKVCIFSMHDEIEYVNRTITMGLNGYITKDVDDDEFLAGIKDILLGHHFFSKKIMDLIVNNMTSRFKSSSLIENEALTKKELEILSFIREGLSNKDIAGKLFRSEKTISVHRYNLMKKLKVNNVVELLNKSKQMGL